MACEGEGARQLGVLKHRCKEDMATEEALPVALSWRRQVASGRITCAAASQKEGQPSWWD